MKTASETFDRAEIALLSGASPGKVGHSGGRIALSIIGPPGSGKTTLVQSLSNERWLHPAHAYVEDAQANPYLTRIGNLKDADFVRSQAWFLSQYERFLATLSGQKSVIVDQDPRAVVLVYSKLLKNIGWISDEQYRRQLETCSKIVTRIAENTNRWQHVLLSAPRGTLLRRVRQRTAGTIFAGPLHDRLLSFFDALAFKLTAGHPSSCLTYDTSRHNAEHIVADLRSRIGGIGPN